MAARRGRPPLRRNAGGRNIPQPDPTLDAIRMMAQSMNAQAAAANRMMAELQRQDRRNDRVPETPTQPQHHDLREFRKNDPPVFLGGPGIGIAERWIQQTEKIFEAMVCSEEKKVTFATFMLQGEAENWWNGIKASIMPNGEPIVWEVFKTAFLNKYIPESARMKKEAEFLRLQQGAMTVTQYVAKFDELSRYSRYLQIQPDDAWKAEKFGQGLRQEILNQVGALSIKDYSELVNRCLVVEQNLNRAIEEVSVPPKRKGNFGGNQKWNPGKKQNPGNFNRNVNQIQECPKCGKRHSGVCLRGLCFKCKQPGHMQNNCPLNKSSGAGPSRPTNQGRVFTLTGEQIKKEDNLVQGQDE